MANAVGQSNHDDQTDRVRQQAGSYRFGGVCHFAVTSREQRGFNQRRPAGRAAQPRKSSWWLTPDRFRGTSLIDFTHVPDRLHARLCRSCRRLRRWRTRWVSRTIMIRQIGFASKPAPTGLAVFVSLCGQSREHRAFNQRRPAGREAQPRKSSWWLTHDHLRGLSTDRLRARP